MVTHSPSLPKGSSVTPFVRSSLHSKSSLHSQSFTFGSFLLAVSSLIINSIQSVFTPQVHSFTQSFISKLIQSFSSLDQGLVHTTVRIRISSLSLAQQAKLVPFARSQVTFSREYEFHSFSLEDKQSLWESSSYVLQHT